MSKRVARSRELVARGFRVATVARVMRITHQAIYWTPKPRSSPIWRNEFETSDEARAAIAAYVSHYHHRPHSGLDYCTPKEVRQTWEDAQTEFEALQHQAT